MYTYGYKSDVHVDLVAHPHSVNLSGDYILIL